MRAARSLNASSPVACPGIGWLLAAEVTCNDVPAAPKGSSMLSKNALRSLPLPRMLSHGDDTYFI